MVYNYSPTSTPSSSFYLPQVRDKRQPSSHQQNTLTTNNHNHNNDPLLQSALDHIKNSQLVLPQTRALNHLKSIRENREHSNSSNMIDNESNEIPYKAPTGIL
jgi:hypothetical protein